MDYVSLIKEPISHELADFIGLFNSSLTHDDGMLGCALEHVKQRAGKRMRPILILLMAKNFGTVSQVTLHSAVGLELLHTASLIHDDVVDEAKERRGQASTNALFDNRVAVLVGDYVLSTALLHIAYSGRERIVTNLATVKCRRMCITRSSRIRLLRSLVLAQESVLCLSVLLRMK